MKNKDKQEQAPKNVKNLNIFIVHFTSDFVETSTFLVAKLDPGRANITVAKLALKMKNCYLKFQVKLINYFYLKIIDAVSCEIL